ncbi:MAG: hypothetical protein LBS48_02675 [Treponema sp.]|jgi:hypothetical protein|nr:hypothetical protein [Treponema sp.]
MTRTNRYGLYAGSNTHVFTAKASIKTTPRGGVLDPPANKKGDHGTGHYRKVFEKGSQYGIEKFIDSFNIPCKTGNEPAYRLAHELGDNYLHRVHSQEAEKTPVRNGNA